MAKVLRKDEGSRQGPKRQLRARPPHTIEQRVCLHWVATGCGYKLQVRLASYCDSADHVSQVGCPGGKRAHRRDFLMLQPQLEHQHVP